METRLEKVVRENNLPLDLSKKIILRNHELSNLIKVKELSSIEIVIDDDLYDFINKFTSALKVSADAVLFAALIDYIEKEEKNEKGKEYKNRKKNDDTIIETTTFTD